MVCCVVKMFVCEVFVGCYVEVFEVIVFLNVEWFNEFMVVGLLCVCSVCFYYLCLVMGCVWVGVMLYKDFQLIGLFKYVWLIDWVMSCFQIQEEVIKQIVDLLEDCMVFDGLVVVLEVEYYCMYWCGMKDDGLCMVSSVMCGVFLIDFSLWCEFFVLLFGCIGD